MRTRFFSLILALFAVLLPAQMWADGETPWAAIYTNGTDYVLHFTYSNNAPMEHVTIDKQSLVHVNADTWYWNVTNTSEGNDVNTIYENLLNEMVRPMWYENYRNVITKVVIDPSFSQARPLSTAFWFATCDPESSRLASIEGLKYLNTSETTDMTGMFWGARLLKSIDVSGFKTGKALSLNSIFRECHAVERLDVGHWDTSSAVNMGNMFISCKKVTSLDVGHWNTGNAIYMHSMFHSCTGLTSIDVNYWDVRKVKTAHNFFYGCTNLVSVDVSNWIWEQVQNLSYFFYNCTSLKSIDVANWNVSSATLLYRMFQNCTSLESINVADWDVSNATSINGIFQGCSSLSQIDISRWDVSSLTELKDVWSGSGVEAIDISNWNLCNLSTMQETFKDAPNVKQIKIGTINPDNTFSWWHIFLNCPNLQAVDLSGVNSAKISNMTLAFANCSSLKTIYVNNEWNVDHLMYHGDMFRDCTSLVGGNGTTFDAENPTDKTYAHIDADGNPGYFTSIDDIQTISLIAETDNSATIADNDAHIVEVTVDASFEANTWTTVCLPFDMNVNDIESVFGVGTEVKQLSGASYANGTITPNFKNVLYIRSGKPYLIKPTQSVTSFTLRKIITAKEPSSITAGGLTMTGTFSPATVTPTGAYWNLYTPTSADYATLAQDADNSESVNGFQAYFTSINGTSYKLTVSDACLSTLYLPYAVEIPKDADYFVANTVTGVRQFTNKSGLYEYVTTMKSLKNGIIPANTAVVIYANPGTYTLNATDSETDEDLSTNMLGGCTEKTPVANLKENEDDLYYVFAQGTLTPAGFKLSSAANCNANKAYMVLPANYFSAGATARFIHLSPDTIDETTGIDDVEFANEKAASSTYYNLNGQRVAAPTKGIYIKDGKKVYVK